jgi:hypothetical protein
MADEASARREPDDAMARQSGAVSEDAQPVTSDADAGKTAQDSVEDSVEDPAGQRIDEADEVQTE